MPLPLQDRVGLVLTTSPTEGVERAMDTVVSDTVTVTVSAGLVSLPSYTFRLKV